MFSIRRVKGRTTIALAGLTADATELRRDPLLRRRFLLRGALLAAGVALALGASLGAAFVREAPLRSGELVGASAQVLEMDLRRRQPDRVLVAYEVPGSGPVQAWVNVVRPFAIGDRIPVLYVAGAPTKVRTATAWRPTWHPPRLALIVVPGLVAALCLLSARRIGSARAQGASGHTGTSEA